LSGFATLSMSPSAARRLATRWVRTGQLVRRLPRSLDKVDEQLRHKLVDVVVVAVVDAVDVS
jgi:hypothetical protein